MNIILIIVLSICLSFSSATDSPRTETLPDYASLCPLSKFCDSSPTEKNSTQTSAMDGSCCQQCSCDPGCFRVGTCCPDAEHLVPKDQSSTPRYECVDANQLLNLPRNITFSQRGTIDYRVVDRCPDINKSNAFPKCDNPDSLRDYVIVSDTDNNYVFKNKHCAACHGVKEVIDWRLQIESCVELMTSSFESVKERNDFILKNCEFVARPPESISVDIATCHSHTRSKCNISGKWDVYDKALEEACLKKRPYQNTSFKQLFSNVYCYLCNIEKRQHEGIIRQTCDSRHDHNDGIKGPRIEFSAILDLEHYHDDPVGEVIRCSRTDVWDHFIQVCRPLLCPVGTMSVYGKCVNFAKSTTGYSSIFFLDLEFRNGNLTLLANGWELLESQIYRIFVGECGMCSSKLFHLKDTPTNFFKMSIKLHTTYFCSISKVFSNLKSLLIKDAINLRFRYLERIFHISLRVTMEQLTGKELDKYRKKQENCVHSLHIQLHHLQNCPRFMMSREEMTDIGFSSSLIETANDLTIITDNATDKVSICAKTYFELLQSIGKSHANIANFTAVNILIGFVCFLLFGTF